MNKDNLIETSNLYIAALLIALNYRVKEVVTVGFTASRKKFVFEVTDNQLSLEEITNKYYANDIKVDAKDFVTAIKEAKSRVHET